MFAICHKEQGKTMEKRFCGNCGSELDEKTGLCPKCNKKTPKKGINVIVKRIILIIIIMALLVSSVGGYFVVFYQPKAVTNDYTKGSGSPKYSENMIYDSDEEPMAVLSQNVQIFAEDDAAKINSGISNVEITNQGLFLDIEEGTSFENLASGDIFYLEGQEDSPLGETYIGKIVEKTVKVSSATYLIETPMVDEVFDVLNIDFSEKLRAENLESIQTIEGVEVMQVDDISKYFNISSTEKQHRAEISTLAFGTPFLATQSMQPSASDDDDIIIDINVDLLKAFGLQEEGTIGFEEYEYTEGYRVNVCITETGKKYHKENCSRLYASKEVISLSDATNEGYEPCFICVPPILKSEKDDFTTDASLSLEGKIGLEDLEYSIDYEWDILNGGGLEQLQAQANGNFITELAVVPKLSLELGGETTTISVPIASVKLQGLEEKLFPLLFISYNGAMVNVSALAPRNDYIRAVTSAVPMTVGFIVYTDISGNITVDASVSFDFNYNFDCEYTAVDDGQWVNEWNSDGEPSFKTALECEASGDADIHFGCSVSLYIFNINIAELAVVKTGIESEGNLKIEHSTEYRKISEQWENAKESKTSGRFYARMYFKIFEMQVKLKTRINAWGVIDYSGMIDYKDILADITIAEWGKRNETRYHSALMTYSAITAKDQQAIYYKDIDNMLIKEEGGYKTILYDQTFFSICGIDASYLYLLIPSEENYEIRRVSKDGTASKVIATDVVLQLDMDENYLYYVSGFDKTSIIRLNRETLQEKQFATFEDDVKFMGSQENEFYVVTEENDIFSMLFGGASSKCWLLNSLGEVVGEYGDDPQVTQYYLNDQETYYQASRMVSDGYLRSIASECYWLSKATSSTVLAEEISGWHTHKEGIFTTLQDEEGNLSMVLYRAEDGKKITVTEVNSDQAFFTICQGNGGEWYFFDQTETELILYIMSEDFTKKNEIKRFSLTEIPYNLNECSMTLMDNRIYFYTMPNDSVSKVLYRYDLISGGSN